MLLYFRFLVVWQHKSQLCLWVNTNRLITQVTRNVVITLLLSMRVILCIQRRHMKRKYTVGILVGQVV